MWWCMPIIPTICEAEVSTSGSQVQGQHGQLSRTISQKIKRAADVTQW